MCIVVYCVCLKLHWHVLHVKKVLYMQSIMHALHVKYVNVTAGIKGMEFRIYT